MEAVEIVRIKDVIIEKVSANDEELEHIFGCSKRQAGDMRREMKKLPSQQKHLRNDGQLVTIKGFDEYLQYRGTQTWKKEMEKSKKMRSVGWTFLTKIKNLLKKEINTDWRIVALDLNQDNDELRNQMKALIQENVDLRKNLQMYKEKENVWTVNH